MAQTQARASLEHDRAEEAAVLHGGKYPVCSSSFSTTGSRAPRPSRTRDARRDRLVVGTPCHSHPSSFSNSSMSTRSRLRPVAFRSRYAQTFRRERRHPTVTRHEVGEYPRPVERAVRELDRPIWGHGKPSRPVVMNVTRSTGIWLITPQRLSALSRLSHTSCRGGAAGVRFVCSVASPRCADQANRVYAARGADQHRSPLPGSTRCGRAFVLFPREPAPDPACDTRTPKPVSISSGGSSPTPYA